MDVELKAMELEERKQHVEVMKKKIRIKTNY
jgi:hypothetical protein